MDTLLPGISAERVPTSRLTVNVLSVAGRPAESTAVLFPARCDRGIQPDRVRGQRPLGRPVTPGTVRRPGSRAPEPPRQGCPLVVPAAYRGPKLRAVRRGDLGGVQT